MSQKKPRHNDFTELYGAIYREMKKMEPYIIGKKSTHVLTPKFIRKFKIAMECAKRLHSKYKSDVKDHLEVKQVFQFISTHQIVAGKEVKIRDEISYMAHIIRVVELETDAYCHEYKKNRSYTRTPEDLQDVLVRDLFAKLLSTQSFRWWD